MTNLQQAIAQLSHLSNVELSYISTLAASSIKPTWKGSLLLDLPRELRDKIYHFTAARFYKLTYHDYYDRPRPTHNRLAFTLVNKQVRSEFTKALWEPEVIQGRYLDTMSEPQIWRTMPLELLKYTFRKHYNDFTEHTSYTLQGRSHFSSRKNYPQRDMVKDGQVGAGLHSPPRFQWLSGDSIK